MGALLRDMRRAAMVSAAMIGVAGAATAQAQEAEAVPAAAAPDDVAKASPTVPGSAETTTAETATESPPAPPLDHLPAGTIIEIRVDEPVNSKTHKTGDWYAISLSRPVMLGETVLIPAGTPGRGQVVHAAKSGWGGKAGELILGARYLEFDGRQVALRAMKLGDVGENNEGIAFAASVAGGLVAMPLVFAINGKNADIQAGMLATAKLTADLFPPPAATTPAPEGLPTDESKADPAPAAVSEDIKSVPTKQEDL